MYKKGVRSMPKCIKRELVSIFTDVRSTDDIIPIEISHRISQKEIDKIIRCILSVRGLPSFWFVSFTNESGYALVFEKKLTFYQSEYLNSAFESKDIFNFSIFLCLSDYYGIY